MTSTRASYSFTGADRSLRGAETATAQDAAGRPGKGRGRTLCWLVPLLLLLTVSAVFHFTQADLVVCRLFYHGSEVGWPLHGAEPWRTIDRYSILPAWAIAVGGLVVAAASAFQRRMRAWRKAGLFLALTLAIGPGLIINLCMKDHWGRPRPAQTRHFGGQRDFLPVWQPGNCRGCSFPSGHASMGFYLMAPAFLLYRRRPRLALAFLLLGLTSGGLIGLGRIVQGRHFPSDVLWSAGFVYFTGLALYHLLGLARDAVSEPAAPGAGRRFEPAEAILSIDRARPPQPGVETPAPATEPVVYPDAA